MQVRQQPASPIRLHRRSGVVTFEFIIWLPVLVILLLAIVEFAQIYAVDNQVQEASRFGAKIASELDRADLRGGGAQDAADDIKAEVDDYLASAGLTASCQVILEHNTCIEDKVQVSLAGAPGGCLNCTDPPTTPALPDPIDDPNVAYVRITVCVDLEGNVPNCLQTFGFDIDDCVLEHSTTFRIEDDNNDPNAQFTAASNLPAGCTATPTFPFSSAGGVGFNAFNCANTNPPADVVINCQGNVAGGGTVTINFDGSISSDAEEPNADLTFAWTTTAAGTGAGVAPPAGAGETFIGVQFNIPPDPDPLDIPGNQGPNTATYTVTLTVTDGCNDQGTCTFNITINSFDTD